jgi:hypothetical protein
VDRFSIRSASGWPSLGRNPRRRRKGLVELALGLGGDGVEHERGLAGAGHPDERGDLALRDADGDVPKVVLASSGDGDELLLAHELLWHGRPPRICTVRTIDRPSSNLNIIGRSDGSVTVGGTDVRREHR